MFFSTHLLYKAIKDEEVELNKKGKTCALCGFQSNDVEIYRFSEKFIDFDLFMDKESHYNACSACAFIASKTQLIGLNNHYLATKKEYTPFNLNHSSLKAKQTKLGQANFVTGQKIVDILHDPPKEHWMLMIRDFGSKNAKHISLNAKVNYGKSDLIWVNISQKSIAIPRFKDETYQTLYDAIYKLKKYVPATSKYQYYFINSEEPHEESEIYDLWHELNPILEPHKNTIYYHFIYNYVVPSHSLIGKLSKKKK